MSMIDDTREELRAALAGMAEEREGFDDMARLNLVKAVDPVRAQIAAYERRRLLIVAADRALSALDKAMANLRADGYPALGPLEILPEALAELVSQRRTYDKALAKFTAPEEAEQIVITAGPPEEKA